MIDPRIRDTIANVGSLGASLLHGSLMSGAIALAGCKDCSDAPPGPAPSGEGPLHLVEGRFLDLAVVELAFSEPLAPVDGVDPAKFRLSIAHVEPWTTATQCLDETHYCDLGLGISDYGCAQCYDYGFDQDCGHMSVVVTSLALDPDDDSRLLLGLTPPLDAFICTQLEAAGDDGAILAHYSRFLSPTITDRDGDPLADIAPHWALSDLGSGYLDGIFPRSTHSCRSHAPPDSDPARRARRSRGGDRRARSGRVQLRDGLPPRRCARRGRRRCAHQCDPLGPVRLHDRGSRLHGVPPARRGRHGGRARGPRDRREPDSRDDPRGRARATSSGAATPIPATYGCARSRPGRDPTSSRPRCPSSTAARPRSSARSAAAAARSAGSTSTWSSRASSSPTSASPSSTRTTCAATQTS